MRRLSAALVAVLLPVVAHAFKVEDSTSKFSIANGVAVIQEPGVTYTVSEIPTAANRFEATKTLDGHPEFSNLTLGDPVGSDEAIHVVEEYLRHVAFDFGSIVIRDFRVGTQNYVFWCTNPALIGCLNWQGRAGTWIEFSLNGANRSGGMTGFHRTILLIRKVPGVERPM